MPRRSRFSLIALALLVAGCSDSSGPERFGCDRIARYNIGETVNGSIRSNDCSDPDDTANGDFYQVRQATDGPVSFTLDVPLSSVPMFLALITSDEDLVDAIEVLPGEEGSVGGLLDEGTYFVAIGTDQPGTGSTYTLSSERALPVSGTPFLNCNIIQAYAFGATVNGTLAAGDCTTPDATYLDRYQFTLATARTVTITLESGAFDAYLYLFDSQGNTIAQNDDNGMSVNSRISIPLPAGTYSIGATAFEAFGAGPYTLRTQ